jgi:hypothetical protein
VEADKYVMNRNIKDQKKKNVDKNLEKLHRADLHRKKCYETISRLDSIAIKDGKSIDAEGNKLHELFSKLKLAQADLSKCLLWKSSSSVVNDRNKEDCSMVHEELTFNETEHLAKITKAEDEIQSED